MWVTGSVRWEASMRYLLGQGFTRFIELGPGTALSGFMKRIDKNAQMLNVAHQYRTSCSSPRVVFCKSMLSSGDPRSIRP